MGDEEIGEMWNWLRRGDEDGWVRDAEIGREVMLKRGGWEMPKSAGRVMFLE